ncbi:hypothetical protein TCAL_01798 [Tigriopus californicus]|uniref:Heme-binding protein 2 n=1 Tax=Tigriopus californicus TaxID=6832 RepID=A0A553N7D8_TIGCA|nr:uncharacterized protein LOC131885434 [Tigriopus californicus]TRY61358.1 hypothetical protein TCAL_01798 [Tigriopus californicus]|eukprot:TCALIF_01798-PA protein Name:"Similar to hebp1 Heme-binding protein 1 (Xenopus tropicalis)" AED:0.00 eAED:0.00 QI:143/1/1/1/1/1/3/109/492
MKVFLVIAIALAVAQARPQEDTVKGTEGPTQNVEDTEDADPVQGAVESRFAYADEKYEHIKYETVETKDGFEKRKYPESKWICTEFTPKNTEDVFANWQEKYGSGFEVMASEDILNDETYQAFKKLCRYGYGVNSDYLELNKTYPYFTKFTTQENEPPVVEVCSYAGAKYNNARLPEPQDEAVYIRKQPEMVFYVSQFSGFVFSEADVTEPQEELTKALEAAAVEDFDKNVVYVAEFNGPFTAGDKRQNEVWVPVEGQKYEVSSSNNEELPYEVLVENEEYELRKYKPAKYVCNKIENYNVSDDPFKGWQEKFDDAFQARSNIMREIKQSYKKSGSRTDEKCYYRMFKSLYQYIIGFNAEFMEIDMTSPVVTKRTIKEAGKTEDIEMCFYGGSRFDDRNMPAPKKSELYLKEAEEQYVYVTRFGGYALSFDDWDSHHQELRKALGDKKFIQDQYFTVGYDSPYKVEDRRNEVWVEVAKGDLDIELDGENQVA